MKPKEVLTILLAALALEIGMLYLKLENFFIEKILIRFKKFVLWLEKRKKNYENSKKDS